MLAGGARLLGVEEPHLRRTGERDRVDIDRVAWTGAMPVTRRVPEECRLPVTGAQPSGTQPDGTSAAAGLRR